MNLPNSFRRGAACCAIAIPILLFSSAGKSHFNPDSFQPTSNVLITTEEDEALRNVVLEFSAPAVFNQSVIIAPNEQGGYSFAPIDPQHSWKVTPYLNEDATNGVSIFDCVLLSRHILGVQPLSSPYKMIAADVNKDKKITTSDLLYLKQMALGNISSFPNNTSWRFVRSDYVFPVPTNPWAQVFPESVTFPANTQQYYVDFIAIKIGDINSSASLY